MPKKKATSKPQPSVPRGIDWDSVRLGQRYDTEIARELGCDVSSVTSAREARRIPAFASPGAPRGRRTEETESRGVRLPKLLWQELDELAADHEVTTPRLVRSTLEEMVQKRRKRRS